MPRPIDNQSSPPPIKNEKPQSVESNKSIRIQEVRNKVTSVATNAISLLSSGLGALLKGVVNSATYVASATFKTSSFLVKALNSFTKSSSEEKMIEDSYSEKVIEGSYSEKVIEDSSEKVIEGSYSEKVIEHYRGRGEEYITLEELNTSVKENQQPLPKPTYIRPENQDKFIGKSLYKDTNSGTLVGFFDNVGAESKPNAASKAAHDWFTNNFTKNLENSKGNVEKALVKTTKEMQSHIEKNLENLDSDCNAVISYIDYATQKIYTVTLGKCQANIYRNIKGKNKSIPLSMEEEKKTYTSPKKKILAQPVVTSQTLKKDDIVLLATSNFKERCSEKEITTGIRYVKDLEAKMQDADIKESGRTDAATSVLQF